MSRRLISLAGAAGLRSALLLSAATLPMVLATPVLAQAASGVLSGTVRSVHGAAPIAGAQVRVVETGGVAVTDSQGRYRFGALPAGPKTVQIDYVGFGSQTLSVDVGAAPAVADVTMGDVATDPEATTVSEILVTGRRAGQARELNAQRSADNTRNIVSADQAGRFPDLNAAESLRRVPGVTVQREVTGGDGRYVSIRGLDSGLNNTQINGMNAAQPEKANRRVPLDMIQTSALASITVHKTLTADQDSDGIGGAVELETATAFDFAGPVADITLRGFQQDLRGKTGLIGDVTLASRFGDQDQFGVLLSVAHAQRQTQGYVFYNDEDQLAFVEDDPSSGITPIQYHQTEYQNERETLSANLALSWRIGDHTDLDFKGSFNRLYDKEQSRAFYLEAGTDEYDDDGDLVLTEPGTANIFNQYEETELTQKAYVLHGETRAGALTLDYSLGYSEAMREEPFDNEVAFQAELESNLMGYTQSGGFPVPNLTANDRATIANPDSYELGYNDIDIDTSRNERTAATFNLTYDFADFWLSSIKAGVKFERSERTLFEGNVLELTGPLTLRQFGIGDLIDVSRSGAPYPAFLSLDQARVRNWREYGLDLATKPGFTNEYVEDGGIPLDEDSYTSREDIFGAYVMGKVDRDVWDLTGGLRLDYTRVESDNYELIELEGEDPIYGQTTGKGDYLSVLPRVQFNYRPTSDSVFRAAYFSSIARPEPLYMSGAIEIEEEDGEVDVTVGNPGLEPAYAHNLDFSYERYFDSVGVISVGAYVKYIEKFIFSGVAPETDGDLARFENDPRLAGKVIDDVITYTNGKDATIYGLELNLVKNFPDLPGVWGGLGVYANLTVQRSEADAGVEGATEGDFFYAPELFYTAALTYQKYGLEGSLAWSWRDEQAVRFSTYNTRIMEEAYGSLDLQMAYRLNSKVKFTLDAVDVLNDGSDPVVDERFGSTGLLEGATYVGRSVTAGINVRF